MLHYPLPNGELVRVSRKDDGSLDYKNATYVLKHTSPACVAYKQYSDKHIDVVVVLDLEDDGHLNKEHPVYQEYIKRNAQIVILSSVDRERGGCLSDGDRGWLKNTIEAQSERFRRDAAAQDLKL